MDLVLRLGLVALVDPEHQCYLLGPVVLVTPVDLLAPVVPVGLEHQLPVDLVVPLVLVGLVSLVDLVSR